MSRYKESVTLIGNLPEVKTDEDKTQIFRAGVTGLLCDMALSLAVIADKLTEESDGQKESS